MSVIGSNAHSSTIKNDIKYDISTEGDQCYNTFYPDVRYDRTYSVGDKYINGVLCYAKWYWRSPGGLYSAQTLNGNNCTFYYVNVYTFYYYLWTPY